MSDQVLIEIRQIRQLLTGNGDPEQGIIFRLCQVERAVDQLDEDIKDISTANNQRLVGCSTKKRNGILIPKFVLEEIFKWLLRLAVFGLVGAKVYELVIRG